VAVFRPPVSESVELDPAKAAVRRAERDLRLNVLEIPQLRLLGFTLVAFAVLLHDRFVTPAVGLETALAAAALLVGYPLASWGLLWALSRRVPASDVGIAFLVIDLLVLDVAIYATGGDRSWLFFILCARAADQSHVSVRRALAFAHLVPGAYAALIVYLAAVEGRAVDVAAELAKLGFLYGTSLYIALTATIAEQRRIRAGSAIRVARDLIRQLQEKSVELEDARRRAEAASEAKSRFLATMSHELRTPLNSIIGFSQVLATQSHGVLGREQAVFVDSILTSGRRLLAMVNDILALAEADAGRLELQLRRFDVAEAVADAITTVEPLAREKSLDLISDVAGPSLEVEADLVKFRHIVRTLLTNAIKFTPPLGHVKLTASVAADSEARQVLRVSVRDTGIGLAPEDQARVFDAFELVDTSAGRRQSGVGLGLALARRLVLLHRGRIWVDSEGPGRGSVFSFEIPLTASQAAS
jgi:signal transduction histidine kinase